VTDDDVRLIDVWPVAWPDLVLRTPDCPMCGTPGRLFGPLEFAVFMHPTVICPNEDCRAWTWDATVPRAELLADPVDMGDPESAE